jgi:hypothetical protein
MSARARSPPACVADDRAMTSPFRTTGVALGSVNAPGGGRNPTGRQQCPPLRQNNQPDKDDPARVRWYWSLYRSQDGALLARDRTIEECVRMLCGQQWAVFNPALNRFFDISDWMTNAEKRWRQRPVINKLLKWFIITHARLTENPPILTFLPGPDALDAELAEVMDVAFKLAWRDADMTDVVDRLAMWAIPAGRAHLISRIDLTKGPWKPWVGNANVPIVGPDPQTGAPVPILGPDQQPVLRPAQGVPFTKAGQPAAGLSIHDGSLVPLPGMEPHSEREGGITVDVASPLEVRGEWGPTPWFQKRWHAREQFLTPDQVYSTWGVEVQPDTAVDDANGGILDRMLYGTGYFGAASARGGSGSGGLAEAKDGLCRVIEVWEKPCDYPGMEETEQAPGGRYIALTSTAVLRDGPRTVRFPYTSPIHTFDFVRVPGRPSGTSPQESLNGPQRSYNKLRAQVMEHANLISNPRFVFDANSGIEEGQWTNEPGRGVRATIQNGIPPVQYVTPPNLGADVYRAIEFASEEIDDLGALKGTQGVPQSDDQSGEAIKELRFNSDRFLGPTTRRWVEEFARMAETWMAYFPFIWDEARVLSFAGTDNIATTVNVLPLMFQQGKVHVIPDVESMLPEGRGERQAQVYKMYTDGIFGLPGSPQAIGKLMELGRFPNISRTAKPGGPDATTAEQENGKLSMGAPAASIPILPWYDDQVHVMVHERVMKSPEFLKLPPPVQQQYALHWQQHVVRIQQAMAAAQAQQNAQLAQQAALQGKGPQPPENGPSPAPSHAPPHHSAHAPSSTSQSITPPIPDQPAGMQPPTGLSMPSLAQPTQG